MEDNTVQMKARKEDKGERNRSSKTSQKFKM